MEKLRTVSKGTAAFKNQAERRKSSRMNGRKISPGERRRNMFIFKLG